MGRGEGGYGYSSGHPPQPLHRAGLCLLAASYSTHIGRVGVGEWGIVLILQDSCIVIVFTITSTVQ